MKERSEIGNLQPLPNEHLNLYNNDEPSSERTADNTTLSKYAKKKSPSNEECMESFCMYSRANPSLYQTFNAKSPNQQAKFIQIYFMDPQERIELRMDILHNDGIQCEIVESQ